jgi:hypothetical protein
MMALPQSRIERDELNRHFHALRGEAFEMRKDCSGSLALAIERQGKKAEQEGWL